MPREPHEEDALNAPDPGFDPRPGRSCPLHYRYRPEVFDRPAEIEADTVYVAGGLYGNRPALDALERMLGQEQGNAVLVFNGDFNWFDAGPGAFEEVNKRVLEYDATRGNVETELASEDAGAGCGCGYPDSVSDLDVARSNAILERVRATSRQFPALRARLAALPMHLVARVGLARIGIVHGDAESLAGWNFDVSALDDRPCTRQRLADQFQRARLDGFASSHTCLPVMRRFAMEDREFWVANNGAAGMPNFAGARYGVVTRISLRCSPDDRVLYRMEARGAYVEALRVDYDHARFVEQFLADWPEGSDAHRSYFRRIVEGPNHRIEQARPRD